MKGLVMTRKDYIKLADYLGTFKYHLESFLKNNQIDFNEKQDLSDEFINLKDNITTMLKKDNRLFSFDKFNNEIDRIMLERKREDYDKSIDEYYNETSEHPQLF